MPAPTPGADFPQLFLKGCVPSCRVSHTPSLYGDMGLPSGALCRNWALSQGFEGTDAALTPPGVHTAQARPHLWPRGQPHPCLQSTETSEALVIYFSICVPRPLASAKPAMTPMGRIPASLLAGAGA